MKLLALSLLLCSSAAVYSQTQPMAGQSAPVKVGGYLGYQYNLHNAAFSQLPGVPSCCPEFQTGSGAGFAIGALYELPVSSRLSLLLRGGYSAIGATLKETETIGNALQNGQVVSAEVEHYLETTLGIISFQPAIAYTPFDVPLAFTLGLEGGYIAVKSYDQREVLVRPENAIFQDTKSGVRNEVSGDIADAASLRLAGFAGVTTEIPIGANLTLAPSLEYFHGFTNVIPDSSWGASTVRLATAIKFALSSEPEPAPPVITPEPPPVEPTPVPNEPAFTAALALATTAADGQRQRVESLVIEETELEEHIPVLFHVFFAEGSAALPQQALNLLEPQRAQAFSEDALEANAMAVYRDVLNILGSRLRSNPSMTVTLTGCNTDIGQEKGNIQLSRQRADAVKEYLVSVWKIDPARITVRARNLPAEPSNNALADGQEENRRVEITASDAAVTAPVRLKDVSRMASPAAIEITPVITAGAGLKGWRVDVGSDRQLASFTGTTERSVVWNIDPEEIGENTSAITIALSADDRNGRTRTVSETLPTRTLTLQKKRYEIRDDRRYEKFSLILFGYNETDLEESHRATLETVKARVTPQSTVTILGYTDRTGDPSYNRQLAARRCENVRSYLTGAVANDQMVVNAVGSDVLLFDNSTPQGRSYSRTVQVIIETPVQ